MQIKKPRALPTPLTLMMLVIIVAAITTWLLPAGQYSKLANNDNQNFIITSSTNTKTLPFTQNTLDSLSINIPIKKFEQGDIRKAISVPNTYQKLSRKPQGFIEILEAPIKGVIDSIDIILFVLFIGGFMAVFNKTGALFNGIKYLGQNMKGREKLLIVVLVFIFSFLGASYGMDVEAIVFYPVLVPLFIAAGYDLIVPLAIVFGGTCTGAVASFSNPFAVIIASNSAGINWTDGLYERLLFFVIATFILTWYILRYAAKVKKDPASSICLKIDGPVKNIIDINIDGNAPLLKLTLQSKLLLSLFFLTFTTMIVGIVFFEWWTLEMAALFLGSAILTAVIYRMTEKDFVDEFVKGAQSLLSVALIIGLARGVTIILNEGLVGDSILFYASTLVQHFSPVVFILMIMIFYFFFAILVSSSSGMAVLTMPIIGALAIIINIPGKEIVNAYLFGIGIMFLISPTGSVFPALLMVQVSYKAWLKFIMPYVFILMFLSAAFLIVGVVL